MKRYCGQGNLFYLVNHIDELSEFVKRFFDNMEFINDEPFQKYWYEKENEERGNIEFTTFETGKEYDARKRGEKVDNLTNNREWSFIIDFKNKNREEQIYGFIKIWTSSMEERGASNGND